MTLTCSATTTTPPPPNGPAIRINEVQTGTTASGSDEFVELFNNGSTAADLSGWSVVYRSSSGTSDTTLATIPAGTTIPGDGFYLLGGASYDGATKPAQVFSSGLSSSGGSVGVRDGSDLLVDSVGWGNSANTLVEGTAAAAPPETPSPGSSLARVPDGHDTNNNASDFSLSSRATPGAANA